MSGIDKLVDQTNKIHSLLESGAIVRAHQEACRALGDLLKDANFMILLEHHYEEDKSLFDNDYDDGENTGSKIELENFLRVELKALRQYGIDDRCISFCMEIVSNDLEQNTISHLSPSVLIMLLSEIRSYACGMSDLPANKLESSNYSQLRQWRYWWLEDGMTETLRAMVGLGVFAFYCTPAAMLLDNTKGRLKRRKRSLAYTANAAHRLCLLLQSNIKTLAEREDEPPTQGVEPSKLRPLESDSN